MDIITLPDNPSEAIEALGPTVRELKRLAMDMIVQDRPEYPTTKKKLEESINQKGVADLTRAFHWANDYYSVSCTFDQYEAHRWHISIVRMSGPMKFHKPGDDVCEIAAQAFLGEGYQEIPCEGKIITQIRHFVKVAE
jgi:hypothetical protein